MKAPKIPTKKQQMQSILSIRKKMQHLLLKQEKEADKTRKIIQLIDKNIMKIKD